MPYCIKSGKKTEACVSRESVMAEASPPSENIQEIGECFCVRRVEQKLLAKGHETLIF